MKEKCIESYKIPGARRSLWTSLWGQAVWRKSLGTSGEPNSLVRIWGRICPEFLRGNGSASQTLSEGTGSLNHQRKIGNQLRVKLSNKSRKTLTYSILSEKIVIGTKRPLTLQWWFIFGKESVSLWFKKSIEKLSNKVEDSSRRNPAQKSQKKPKDQKKIEESY